MIGQYTDEEFIEMLKKAGSLRSNVNYITKLAYIQFGKYTVNYYRQELDGSWTNYICKTL